MSPVTQTKMNDPTVDVAQIPAIDIGELGDWVQIAVPVRQQYDKALVVIDVQNEFLSPSGNFPLHELSRQTLVSSLRSLIPRFRDAGGHIIWVQAIYQNRFEEPEYMKAEFKGNGVLANDGWLTAATHVFSVPCCKPSSWGAELFDDVFEMAQGEDSIVTKTHYSAFRESKGLLKALREREVKEAYFCGVASGTCVLATVLDALKLGEVKVRVVKDCMGFRRLENHRAALNRMEELGIRMVRSEKIRQEDLGGGDGRGKAI